MRLLTPTPTPTRTPTPTPDPNQVFRAGPRDEAEGGPSLAAADGAPCRSYLPVPPHPGTLWLFPGSMPHLVMRRKLPPGLAEPETPRVSIGVNPHPNPNPNPNPSPSPNPNPKPYP